MAKYLICVCHYKWCDTFLQSSICITCLNWSIYRKVKLLSINRQRENNDISHMHSIKSALLFHAYMPRFHVCHTYVILVFEYSLPVTGMLSYKGSALKCFYPSQCTMTGLHLFLTDLFAGLFVCLMPIFIIITLC